MPRLRVLVISAYYFPFQGGTETHARWAAKALASSGAEVIVLTKQDDRGSPAVEVIDSVRVYRVPPAGPRGGLRKWSMIPFVVRKALALKRDYDVIYCPGYQGIGLAALWAGAWLGRPVVLRSGNLGVLRGDQWNAPLARWHVPSGFLPVRWLKSWFTRTYKRADMMFCNCRENETEALECGMPRDRLTYLPNGVDITRFRPVASDDERAAARRGAGWPADSKICLYVGRLSAEKGVMELLDAWRAFNTAGWTLVLVGPDMPGHAIDAGPAARQFVADHGMQNRVVFHGESTDTAPLLRGADLYVQPSHYESFSNALVEAMGTGLPVVATRVGGMLDCIVDGHNGVLCHPRDAADLARALQSLVNAPGTAAALGRHARETIVESFHDVTMSERMVSAIASCVERRALRDASARA